MKIAVKKPIKTEEIKEVKKTIKPKYELIMQFNGETFTTKTNDIKEAILSLKPEILYTEIYITVTKGELVMERFLNLKRGRNLFINEDFINVFIINLLF